MKASRTVRPFAYAIVIAVIALNSMALFASSIEPLELRCEYLKNPEGIDVARPRLSWRLKASSPELRGAEQTAYRILAASSRQKLAADLGDLWDSGKISNAESLHHEYGGRKLLPKQPVFWKVMVWDENDSPSQWSPAAQWSMGLLKRADWGQARWIGFADEEPADTKSPNPPIPPSPLLRRSFVLNGPIKRAALHVTARGLYECRLNGKRVGDHCLAPEWTDYKKRIQYQTYEVTNYLKEGENAIAATMGDGWYLGRMGPVRWDKKFPRRGVYGPHRRLLAFLQVEYQNGTSETLVSDKNWKVNGYGPIRRADNFLGEDYDARKDLEGWDMPGFDDSAWQKAVAEPLDNTPLVAQMNEPIRVVADLPAVAVSEPKPGVYIFDIGQNIAGWCRIRISGKAGQQIVVRHGEMLNPDGTLYTSNLGTAGQIDRYTLSGDGEETFEPHFTYHGFRYVEVRGLSKKPQTKMLTGRALASDTTQTISFVCSNPMLNQLVKNATWTQRGNMHSVPTDCPQRDERMGWMGDALIFSQSAIFNMDMAAFNTKWIQDIRDAQASDGSFPDYAPQPFKPEEHFKNAPGWADAGVVLPWRLYQNYADKEVLRHHIQAAKRFIDGIKRDNPDLIRKNNVSLNYGDWLNGDTIKADGYPQKGAALNKEIFATAFFAHSTSMLANMCRVLGEEKEAKRYAALAHDIREIFCKRFVDNNGKIKGDTQAGYALALHFDLLPEAIRPKSARHMVEAINAYNGRFSTGIHSTHCMMLELSRCGYNDLAYKLVRSTRFPSWGYSINQGATTIWERWDGFVKNRGFQSPSMNSFNHYALGAVVEWLYRNVAGINLDENNPGYKHFVIHPHPPRDLAWVKAGYDSIRGPIVSEWNQKADQFHLHVEIPANTKATVFVPARNAESVSEGGRPAGKARGVKFLRMEDAAAVFEVISGQYNFQAEIRL